MKTEKSAWFVFAGVLALLWLAISPDGWGWFHLAEAVAGIVILLGAGGFITGRTVSGSR
jgi:hypothetical protein